MQEIFSQQELHRFFFKSAIAIALFWITLFLSQMFNLASFEGAARETNFVAKAEVDFYNQQLKLTDDQQLKLKIAIAKQEASDAAIETSQAMVELIDSIKTLCFYASPVSFVFGILFWVLYAASSREEYKHPKPQEDKSPIYLNKCT
ncbi:hypothetical protein [Vibrio sp. RM-69-4]|uniref:hypothetical protein n=1 Tax=Vibrio sp. RM-69-4 TaxID=2950157 RepID=UPI00215C94EE|nr:hypothetical protein [Vibrio sp. RM-69-4]MCR9421883.1 hypothetical protein [Vibrio sp. RM-69-4]